MKGLRRNVKYLSGTLLKLQMVFYLILLLVFSLICLEVENPLDKFSQEVTFYWLLMTFALILLAVGFGESYCYVMVSLGSARKPTAVGILLSIHAFLVLQMVILFGMAALVEDSVCMQVIRLCPLGTIALPLLITGIGLLLDTLSLKGHKVCVGILGFILAVVYIVLLGVISAKFAAEVSKELLMPYNSVWFLTVGLAVDLVGAYVYYKTVIKVDLKLA